MDLVVVARRSERLSDLTGRLTPGSPGTVRAIQADLSRSGEVERVGAEIGEMPVDMLVNNAGPAHYLPFADLPSGQAAELVDLNVLAAEFCRTPG